MNARKVTETLQEFESGNLSPDDALGILASVIRGHLDDYKVPHNIQNAGQIGSYISAELFPEHIMSRGCKGKPPDFSDSEPEPHAIERGMAILLGRIKESADSNMPSAAASKLYDRLKDLGHLPRPEDFFECGDRLVTNRKPPKKS